MFIKSNKSLYFYEYNLIGNVYLWIDLELSFLVEEFESNKYGFDLLIRDNSIVTNKETVTSILIKISDSHLLGPKMKVYYDMLIDS